MHDTDTPFVCGLLRNFGVLVLRQYFPDLFKRIFDEWVTSFATGCYHVCGLDHQFISYLLFMRWNLPMNIVSVFRDETSLRNFNSIIRKIMLKADEVLKSNNYGQWDTHAHVEPVDSDLFSFDLDDFNKSVQQYFQETDELAASFVV